MTKKELVIIGAGDVGGFIVNNQELFEEKYNILGFLDDDPQKWNTEHWDVPVLGPISDIDRYKGASVLVSLSAPKIKAKILNILDDSDYHFPSFVATNSWISKKVQVGKGSIIYPGVSINYGSCIGAFCVINMNCALGHNAQLGNFCALAPGVNLGGFTTLGTGVAMGIGSATKESVHVGSYCTVGGQAMIIADCCSHATVVGVPAKALVHEE